VRIRDVINRGWPVFSFEFFPPKTDEGAKGLMHAVEDLNEIWKPDFVSVTYGAGGSTRERTIEMVVRLQGERGIRTMAHLTCVGTTKEELRGIVDRLVESGIQNVLALRGDAPGEGAAFKPVEGGFAHATELIAFLAENWHVDIGGACYPEGHVESRSPQDDLRWARAKVEKGASFLITQLFFDNKHYFDFVARARAEGVRVPIIPGIMPITNVAQVERFTKLCGASIPPELAARLARVRDDPALVMATGIEHAIKQCRNLLERGAPGLHFYTLNKSYATRCVLAAVRKD
jgi:methylenetetrahydrofolate reductase (NADPH)